MTTTTDHRWGADMTTAMQGGAIPASETGPGETVIDLARLADPVEHRDEVAVASNPAAAPILTTVDEVWSPSLYGPRSDEQVPSAPLAPTPAAAAPPAIVIDAEALAAMAAEVAVSVARHREELAAAMAELTALQRTLRSEVRAVITELDRIAAGVATERVEAMDVVAGDGTAAAAAPRRRPLSTRLRRAH